MLRKLVFLLVTAAVAHAQSVPSRSGIVVAAGGGIGSTSITCNGCFAERTTAPGGFVRVGGAVSRYLAFAGEANYWRSSTRSEKASFRYITLTTLVYPSQTSGFYLAGHIGHGQANDELSGALLHATFQSSGIAFGGGLGYEIPLKANTAITPYLNAMGMKSSGSRESISGNVLSVGLSFTFRRS